MAARPHGSPWVVYLLGALLVLVAAVAWLGSANRAGPPEPPVTNDLAIGPPKLAPPSIGPTMPRPPIPTPK